MVLLLLLFRGEKRNKKWLRVTGKASFKQKNHQEVPIMKPPTIIQWYRILRAHHHWTVFQSVRYALWLMR